jgi:tetratricopeptide (TPR) repeat protein
MMEWQERHCPDVETLAAFAEGRLSRTEAAAVIEHLDGCEECMSDVALAMQTESEERQIGRFMQKPWLLGVAAAAAIALVLSLPSVRNSLEKPFHRSAIDRLVAAAPPDVRLVEPRLTGGFSWAAYRGPVRATDEAADPARLKLGGAAGELVERAQHDSSAEAQHAAGVAMVLLQKPSDAVDRLETAARVTGDARSWNDLAAARYAMAVELGRASQYPAALAAADAALRIEPTLPEALFNRGLILEKMGLTAEARRAWQRYLEVDPSSGWATEVRTHLAELPASTRSSRFERDQSRLEQAAASEDARAVRELVDAYRERSRATSEAEYLGRWAEAVQRGDAASAKRWLTTSRAIGEALASLSGESLLRQAVQAIDGSSDESRVAIAAAHVAYRNGRLAHSRRQAQVAEQELRRAAAGFEAVHDPMSFAARYFAASARLAQNDAAGARRDLEQLRTEVDGRPGLIDLGGRVRWELARAHTMDDDWAGAVPILMEGAAAFHRAGERANEAFVEAMLAGALGSLGRPDDAWSARIRSFQALSVEGQPALLATAIGDAVRTEIHYGRQENALALLGVIPAVDRAGGPPTLPIERLVQRAMLQSLAGDGAEALRSAREAEVLAAGIADPAMRARQLADVGVAMGAALALSDPRRGDEQLTQAIAFYRSQALPFALPEPLLLRARCAMRAGDRSAAARDLEEGISTIERQPARSADLAVGTGMLDAEKALYADAITLSLDRGDVASAFAYAERSHGKQLGLAELQRRLDGSGAVVLEIVALPDELVTIGVSQNDAVAGRRPRRAAELPSLAARTVSEAGTAAAATLYDDIIRPVETIIAGARELIIVPDPRLDGVSLAALYDTVAHRRLIERMPVAMASSAASLRRDGADRGAPSVTAIALPSGGASESRALPDAERELAEVSSSYRRSMIIPSSRATLAVLGSAAAAADVLHIAGHTERQAGAGEQALIFTGANGRGFDRLSWRGIVAAPPVRSIVVVLAACETMRRPAAWQTRALSLGEGFSEAGAIDVVGTLLPIADRDARTLFGSLHKQLAAGVGVATALQSVQREAIRSNDGSPSWRAVALLTRRIPAPSSH